MKKSLFLGLSLLLLTPNPIYNQNNPDPNDSRLNIIFTSVIIIVGIIVGIPSGTIVIVKHIDKKSIEQEEKNRILQIKHEQIILDQLKAKIELHKLQQSTSKATPSS